MAASIIAGKRIAPVEVDRFTRHVVRDCMEGVHDVRSDFALGFAAGLDALFNGKIDFEDPTGTIALANRDIERTDTAPRFVTDIIRRHCLLEEAELS